MQRVAYTTRWVVGSPRLASALSLAATLVFATGAAAAAARSHNGPSAPGPVFQVAEAAEARPASPRPAASRASARPRARPKAKPRPAARIPARQFLRGWAYWAPRIRQCESSGNYRAESPTTSASGAYQILDGTWQGHFGVPHASDASPAQQDQAAEELYRQRGTVLWAASAPCWRA